jgi:hypothetical protein
MNLHDVHRVKFTFNFAAKGGKRRGRSPAEIVGSNPTGGMDICLL